jgi:lantibiotic modifying enzyme
LRVLIDKQRGQASRTIEQSLEPLVTFALNRLQSLAPDAANEIVAPSGWLTLAEHLTRRLVFALGPTLRIEHIAAKAISLNSKSKSAGPGLALSEAVRAFPGLFETAAHLLGAWVDAQSETLKRLKRDRALLAECFGFDRRASRATKIQAGLSDPHDRGRSVTLIEFSDRARIIYKPRSCDGEELWFAALRWLNQNGIDAGFYIPRLLAREKYCWMEFLQAKACSSLNAVHSFYFRWGVQTALATVLEASDLHKENWIALNSQPILVDAEALGAASSGSHARKKKSLDRQSLPSLLETGLLPFTSRDRAGRYWGIAPFDATLAEIAADSCWPRYKGESQPPWRYLSHLLRGFDAAARLFVKPSSARNFLDEIISRARIGKQRLFFRSSADYARMLRESLEPSLMILPECRKRWLAQKCCASAVNRASGIAEARALLRCDLPKFVIPRKTFRISRKRFSTEVARLRLSRQLLRRRVLLRTRSHYR